MFTLLNWQVFRLEGYMDGRIEWPEKEMIYKLTAVGRLLTFRSIPFSCSTTPLNTPTKKMEKRMIMQVDTPVAETYDSNSNQLAKLEK